MRAVDRYLLNRVRDAAHGVQQWTGYTVFHLMCAASVAQAGFVWIEPKPGYPGWLRIFNAIFSLTCFYDAYVSLKMQEEWSDNPCVLPSQLLALRAERIPVGVTKVFSVFMIVLCTIVVIEIHDFDGITVVWPLRLLYEYLVFVDPLPPGASKVQQFFERFQRQPVASEAA